ncbi:hypothetical protein LCGC14_0209990 [marine sediment metagenome]|uniref:Uncharacterized protein n=1 Tax=marine sediment metagenome TaxID=412755 RepID=A0A0F9X063_9ZZZZ
MNEPADLGCELSRAALPYFRTQHVGRSVQDR